MVEHDAGEVAVDAIVHVQHVALDAEVLVFDSAARDDVAGDGEGGAGVVASGLGDDADMCGGK